MNDFVKLIEGIKAAMEAFKKWAETIDWKSIHDGIEYISKQLPKDVESVSINLMNRGWFVWFFEGYMADFTEKTMSLVGKTSQEQDEYMESYIRENSNKFKELLTLSYPDRSRQIEDAFKSHELGSYYSSIPSFLVLAEGVGRDIYPKIGIFSKHKPSSSKKGTPVTDDLFDSISGIDVMEEAILKPLRVKSDVTKTINNPTPDEHRMFNRHLIMHGTSNNYGSERNSLKAISLVYFVHESLSHLKNR